MAHTQPGPPPCGPGWLIRHHRNGGVDPLRTDTGHATCRTLAPLIFFVFKSYRARFASAKA